MARQCSALTAAAPETVAGQPSRPLSPATQFATAWGDPAIVLTCGGPPPAALRPTSFCSRIDGVDWLATQGGKEVDPASSVNGDLDFTTIGRSAYVVVHVPGAYQPAADALVDLATTVTTYTVELRPC